MLAGDSATTVHIGPMGLSLSDGEPGHRRLAGDREAAGNFVFGGG